MNLDHTVLAGSIITILPDGLRHRKAAMTMKMGIERILKENVPEVKEAVAVN